MTVASLAVSGVTGEGIGSLAERLASLVEEARSSAPPAQPFVVLRPGRDPFVVHREGTQFHVEGPRVERWVTEANLEDPRQVIELQRRLVRAGVERRLEEAGAERGDEVVIAGVTFEFIPQSDAGDDPT